MNHQRITRVLFILLCLAVLSVAYLWNRTPSVHGQQGDSQIHSTTLQVLPSDQGLLEEQDQTRSDLENLRNSSVTNSIFQPVTPNPDLIEENNQVRKELQEVR